MRNCSRRAQIWTGGAALCETRRVELWQAHAFVALLAQSGCGATAPDGVVERFESNRDARGLADYFERSVFDSTIKSPVAARLMLLDPDFQAQARVFYHKSSLAQPKRCGNLTPDQSTSRDLSFDAPLRILLDWPVRWRERAPL